MQDTISAHEDTIRDLQQQAVDHDSQTEDRDRAIADLNHRIALLEVEKDDLADKKAGLERRVESEAEQMLQTQNDLNEEVAALKATIRDKVEKIRAVEEKSHAAEDVWEEILQARNDEIDQLKEKLEMTAAAHDETVTNLTGEMGELKSTSAARINGLAEQNEDIKRKFRAYVRRSTDTIEHLQQRLEDAKAAVDQEGDNLKGEGEDMLQQLDALVVPTEVPTSRTSSKQKVAKKTRGRKKRAVDSGIGMDGEPVDEESMMIEA